MKIKVGLFIVQTEQSHNQEIYSNVHAQVESLSVQVVLGTFQERVKD